MGKSKLFSGPDIITAFLCSPPYELWGTGISGPMRGLATLPQGGSRSLQWSETGIEVHCFCVCSGSALLGDLLGVSRSRERDLPSVLSIYPRIFLCVFIVYRCIVRIFCLLYSAIY